MVLQYGARQFAVNCAHTRLLGAAPAFFSAFYQWSQGGCNTSKRNVNRAIHTSSSRSREYPIPVGPASVPNNKAPQNHSLERSHEILSQDIRHIMRSLPHSVAVLTTTTREKNERIDDMTQDMLETGKASWKPRKSNQETSSALQSVGHRRLPIPRLRRHIQGFNYNMRSNYYGVLSEEWNSELELEIRELEENAYKDYRGMTLSSFTTVCLSDPPMISFNIRSPSRTLDALGKASGKFMIHILEANSAGAQIASVFSRGGGGTEGFDKLEVEEYYAFTTKNKTRSFALPVIKGPGVKKVLSCQIGTDIGRSINWRNPQAADIIPVGDHHVVFAQVLAVLQEPTREAAGVEGGEEEMWHGLSYTDGQYRDVGGVIDIEPEPEPELGEAKVLKPRAKESTIIRRTKTG